MIISNLSKTIILTAIIWSMSHPVLATDNDKPTSVAQFAISTPDVILSETEVELVVTAHDQEGDLVENADNDFVLHTSYQGQHSETEGQLEEGEGVVEMNFDKAGIYIFRLVDKRNPKLSLSGYVQVKLNREAVRERLRKRK